MIVIGIDPGQSGAVAIYGTQSDAWNIYDTPTIQAARTEYNIPAMAALLPEPSDECQVHAFIELVGPMPKQGVTSTFRFGEGYGIWQGILAALGIPYTKVRPQAWKKAMMEGRNKDKDASRLRALELFPHLADQLNLKKHHNRADALLIAEWGRRTGR